MKNIEEIKEAFNKLVDVREKLPKELNMKIWLSYNGTISYTIAVNMRPEWRYDRRWDGKMRGSHKGDGMVEWVDAEVKRISEKLTDVKNVL